MPNETVEAWILRAGPREGGEGGKLELSTIELPDLGQDELLVEPLLGCWEGNMEAALSRNPVDVCRLRHEKQVVLGNAGVIRVLKPGADVHDFREGDLALVAPIATTDQHGYTIRVFGYDQPNQIGVLAKRTILRRSQLLRFPATTRHSLAQWAGFPIRYTTAWENWHTAFPLWKAQFDEAPTSYVWGWGGGVAFAELQLAGWAGCKVAMCASKPERFAQLDKYGIDPIDRSEFLDLAFDETRYDSDRAYRTRYLRAEGRFLDKVQELTADEGVSIFIDNIGAPVFRATLRALGRCGVITTAGWKHGKQLTFDRATACVRRYTLLHTHGCKRSLGIQAIEFAEESGWLPPAPDKVTCWEGIPELAADFAAEKLDTYFPVFAVNGV